MAQTSSKEAARTIFQAKAALAITEFLMDITIDEFIEQDNANGRVVDWDKLAYAMNKATRKMIEHADFYVGQRKAEGMGF